MPSINQNIRTTQHHFHKISKTVDSYGFFNLLTSDELFEYTESLLPEHRERLFPPTETLSMFLSQVMSQDGSCQSIVNDAAVKRMLARIFHQNSSSGATFAL